MNIKINRLRRKGDIIEGQIFIDNIYVCDTLENDHNCLPTGRYGVVIRKCHQHARKMLIIVADAIDIPDCKSCPHREPVWNNTPMPRFCPQITVGNGAYNRHDGCILVGRRGALGLLLHPKKVFDSLYHRIRKAKARGNKVVINIK